MVTTRIEKRPGRGAGERTPRFLNHYLELCLRIYQLRYVTAPIIHRSLPNIYATPTARTANSQLNALEQLGFIKSRQQHVNQPKVYSQNQVQTTRLLRQHYPSQTFLASRDQTIAKDKINHEVAVSERQTDFHLSAAAHPDLATLSEFRRFNHGNNALPYTNADNAKKQLEPDLLHVLRITTATSWFPLALFIEEDLGNESPLVVLSKLMGYAHWYEQHGQQYLLNLYQDLGDPNPQPALRILVITRNNNGGTDMNRLRYLYQAATDLPSIIRRRVYFTTNAAAQAVRHNNQILTAPIWYPVRVPGSKPRSLFRPA